jgi:hypothetical protein
MWESYQFFFGLRLVSRIFEEFPHPTIQTKIVQHFGREICQKNEKVRGIFEFIGSELFTFYKNSIPK